MKVIKQGKLPGDKEYRTTCRNCKTEFSFVAKEANYVSDQRDGDCLQVSCPLCKLFIYVSV